MLHQQLEKVKDEPEYQRALKFHQELSDKFPESWEKYDWTPSNVLQHKAIANIQHFMRRKT